MRGLQHICTLNTNHLLYLRVLEKKNNFHKRDSSLMSYLSWKALVLPALISSPHLQAYYELFQDENTLSFTLLIKNRGF